MQNISTRKGVTVLAIDPSIRCAGVAIINGDDIVAHGTIKPKLTGVERYKELQRQIADCITQYKPDVLAIELQYVNYGKNTGDATLKTATARGIFIGVFLNMVPKGQVIEVSPTEGHAALGIQGNLKRDEGKRQAVEAIKMQFKIKVSQDEADAIGIGFAARKVSFVGQ